MASSLPRLSMRIGVVQFYPKIGQVHANLKRAKELTDNIQPCSCDLLCFPETAFTGYNFENAAAIEPYLEHPRKGPTSMFCSELAKRLQCYVVAGYPELLEPQELESCVQNENVEFLDSDFFDEDVPEFKPERRIVGANSSIMYGPDGNCVKNYRKSNLFKTDKTWAAAGSGFTTINLPHPLRSVTLAICMDLNPFPHAKWTLEDGPYELANYCQRQGTDLLVLLNAWLDPEPEGEDEHSWSTLRYWAARLRPLWHKNESTDSQSHKTTTVMICNRTGEENGTTFVGSSSVFQMNPAYGRPRILDMMTKKEEGLRIWNIPLDSVKS